MLSEMDLQMYHIAEKFDEDKIWWIGHGQNFGKQSFDELTVGFMGEMLREKG